ncbi:hypothetical protein M8A51_08215 [Schlegelella sp. S2-27]|uniref:Uncharacterized protein n=1 Tax=Caldimonas mangrovi TaxID=2944811 RepID=A0ABT0YM63_9BURK|nr:hypothetical protein [Caldimonas mangrovi]MCM5679514.1 hypothetical protein [Caldimonas mangrovi]
MTHSSAATLSVDWESGEGRLDIGTLLAQAHPRLRRDVLADWKDEIERLLAEAQTALQPDQHDVELVQQRQRNLRRRLVCEKLEEQSIRMAEPLVNGDVLLHLSDGQAVVLYAYDEDVKLEAVDAQRARAHAAEAGTGDYYVREDLPEAPAVDAYTPVSLAS